MLTNGTRGQADPAEERRRLLALRLRARGLDAAAPDAIPRRPPGPAELPLSFAQERLWFLARLRPAPADHVLLLCLHHIACYGHSLALLLEELARAYAALAAGREPALPEPPVQYPDFALWQRDRLRGPARDEQLAFWRRALAG